MSSIAKVLGVAVVANAAAVALMHVPAVAIVVTPPAMPAPPAAIDPPPSVAKAALVRAAPFSVLISVPELVAPNTPSAPSVVAMAGAATVNAAQATAVTPRQAIVFVGFLDFRPTTMVGAAMNSKGNKGILAPKKSRLRMYLI